MAVTIRDIACIATQPESSRLLIVKVDTSEPGLYGVGCATFTQRIFAVRTAIEKHLRPLLLGRDVSRIEDIWHLSMVNGYWRNGPVLNNAISGIDMALWDIKGKMANMPVYDLLGGKSRTAAATYTHADGKSPEEVCDRVREFLDDGYRYIRVQMGGYGGGALDASSPVAVPEASSFGGAPFNREEYMRGTLQLVEHLRGSLGNEVELLHDVHERLHPSQAINLAKDLEQFRLFFLEDLLSPEDTEWFSQVRAQTSTPLAMGELFNNPKEWVPLIEGRLIDFMRMHVSQMGGITPARNAAILGQVHGVRTAWHGPGDTSPVGHAANLHLALWAPNFGIQEWCRFGEQVYEMFPGLPVVRNGYMYANDQPGLGIDIDEKLAAKYPWSEHVVEWTQTRLPDATIVRP